MKAIRLHRVSNPSQAESTHHSIFAQQNRTGEYVSKNDFEQFKVYNIEGESAYSGERKQFQPIVEDVKNSKECIAIVVDCVDRFQRGFREAVIFDDLRKEGKCELHFIQDELVISKDSPPRKIISWDDKVLDAKKYSSKISENVQRGLEGKRDRGQKAGLPKFGYMKNENDLRNKVHIPDPTRFELVKKIFTFYAQNIYSDAEIGKKVSDLGLRTNPTKNHPKGCEVSKWIVRRVLTSRFYCGYVKNSKGEWIIGAHEKMIDESLFDKCQKIRNHEIKQVIRKRTRRTFYAFRGLMTCGFCGSAITFSPQYKKSGKKYIYCKCASQVNKRVGVDCQQETRTVEQINEMFEGFVNQISITDEAAKEIKDFIGSEFDGNFDSAKSNIKMLNGKIKTFGMKKSTLYDDRLNGELDIEFYKSKAAEFDEEVRKIKVQIKEFEIENPNNVKDINQFIKWCRNLSAEYEKMDKHQQHELISILGSKVVMNGKGNQFKWNLPFEQMALVNSCFIHDWNT